MSSLLPASVSALLPGPVFGLPFPLVLSLVSIACFIVWYARAIQQPKGSPPVFPFIVGALSGKFQLKKHGPVQLIHAGYKKLGGCFSLQILHNHVTMFVGPEAQGFFFSLRDKEADQKPVYQFTVPVFGKNIAYDAPRRRMDEQLRFLRFGLQGESMRRHGKKIVVEVKDFFARWGSKAKVVDLHHTMSELIINTASRTLMGREIREHCHERFADLYQQLSDGMTHLTILFPNAPVPLHRARDRARVEIVSLFKEVINKKRARVAEGHALDPNEDLINFLLSKTYVNKDPVTDDDICGLLLATLFAGQHTSTITSTWLGIELVHKPDLIKKLKEEQVGVMEHHDGEMTWEALQDMKLLNACVRETLRKYPPLVMLMRKTLVPLKYKEYTIPKDRVICVVPAVAHQLEEVFSNPSEWNPSRFNKEWDQEQLKRCWIPFGGGMHKCLGQQFGLMQVTAIWSLILRHFDIEAVDPVPGIDYSHLVAGPLPTTRVKFTPLIKGTPSHAPPSLATVSGSKPQEEAQREAQKDTPIFTKAEVAKHTTDDDCWVIIRGKVYDVTKFLRIHPGGKERLFQHAGSDATFAFEAQEHSSTAQRKMTRYEIGLLAD